MIDLPKKYRNQILNNFLFLSGLVSFMDNCPWTTIVHGQRLSTDNCPPIDGVVVLWTTSYIIKMLGANKKNVGVELCESEHKLLGPSQVES
jgi:hypothetical protein